MRPTFGTLWGTSQGSQWAQTIFYSRHGALARDNVVIATNGRVRFFLLNAPRPISTLSITSRWALASARRASGPRFHHARGLQPAVIDLSAEFWRNRQHACAANRERPLEWARRGKGRERAHRRTVTPASRQSGCIRRTGVPRLPPFAPDRARPARAGGVECPAACARLVALEELGRAGSSATA
jgi:hypothetical protein